MIYHIQTPQTPVRASIQLPASKSISNRVLIMNALVCPVEDTLITGCRIHDTANLANLAESDDTRSMLRVLEALDSKDCHQTFDIGAAGTTMRFLTAFLSWDVGEYILTGTERMKNRPIKLLVDALNALGAKIEYLEKEGYPPLKIYGGLLEGGEISLPGNVSSQYISALLMVAPCTEKGLILHLEGEVISRPYIRLTTELMKQFGVHVQWEGDTLTVLPQSYNKIPFTIESDWSGASYWYAITALSPDAVIELPHLFENSLQGDAACRDIFGHLGVVTTFTNGGIRLENKGTACETFIYDFVNQPDLAQTVVVACALLNIPFRFTGLQTLKIKETDRIEALKKELRKLGYVLTDTDDCILEWNGERCEPGTEPVIQTYEDHRMAMAFAPVAILLKEGIKIEDPQVVTKSYPRFWQDLQTAGFLINS